MLAWYTIAPSVFFRTSSITPPGIDNKVLLERIKDEGLNRKDYEWYLELRKYGSVPHAGFGMGLERVVAWICGLSHIRETIPFARTMNRLNP